MRVLRTTIGICCFFCFLYGFSAFAGVSKNKDGCCKYKHFGLIVSGPSGVGKTTLVEELKKKYKNLSVSVSATTRMPRKGEVSGKDYYFLDKSKFQELARKDEFIEYAENYGNYYGSPRRNYIEAIENGKDIVFNLSAEGMQNAKKNQKLDLVSIFILPVDEKALYQRLNGRGTETPEKIKQRLENAKKEMSFADRYDYIIYNDKLEFAVKQLEAIYLAEQKKREICK